jgi:hypothetical protein
MMWGSNSPRFSSLVFPVLSVVLLVLNVALVVQNRTLKVPPKTLASLLPSPGARINELLGLSLDGAQMDVKFANVDHRKTILFVFSTTCGVCKVNWPNWQELTKEANTRSFRLIYANINSTVTRDYFDKYGLSVDNVFADLDARSRAALNLQVTPLTIILSGEGTVERYWAGRLQQKDVSELRTLLSGR